MNLQQLRFVHEAARHNFSLTDVAETLATSQSGVSKGIKDFENELGIDIFVRKGKRFLGLTEPGKDVVELASRVLLDVENLRSVARQFSDKDEGLLTVATTHTQARYALPAVVPGFLAAHPLVQLSVHQGSPKEIVSMLLEGSADIGIATEALNEHPSLLTLPYYSWQHVVVVPLDHPLARLPSLTLAAIAECPIVTYNTEFTGRTKISRAFAAAGLEPDIVVSALDSDVIKTYVEQGLGVGIIASMAFDPVRDPALLCLDGSGLFETTTTWIAVQRGRYLRPFAQEFVRRCVPDLSAESLDAVLPARSHF